MPFIVRSDPLQWWLEAQQQRQYPNLAPMAIDILSASPMSAEPERVFSSCRRAIPWDRAQITFQHLEVVECLITTYDCIKISYR